MSKPNVAEGCPGAVVFADLHDPGPLTTAARFHDVRTCAAQQDRPQRRKRQHYLAAVTNDHASG